MARVAQRPCPPPIRVVYVKDRQVLRPKGRIEVYARVFIGSPSFARFAGEVRFEIGEWERVRESGIAFEAVQL
mgnify:CR=1 FL=1